MKKWLLIVIACSFSATVWAYTTTDLNTAWKNKAHKSSRQASIAYAGQDITTTCSETDCMIG